MEIIIGGMSESYLMEWPKWQLVAYARKVAAALPHERVLTSGRKADIAFSIMAALRNNPEYL
jgi:hypothetical protein